MEGLDWSRVITIVVGLVALLLGWAIGFFDSNNRSEKKIRIAEEKAEIAIHQAKGEAERAAARVAQAEQMAAPAAPAPSLPGTSLLRLWLDERERPCLDLDGQTVDTAQISDHNRKRLIALLTVMRPWIEGKPAAGASVPPPLPAAPSPAREPAFTPAPVAAPIAPPAKKEEKPAAPLSIVGQIDEILQERLAGTALEVRGIKLVESPEGGAIVVVGSQKFAGVGEVTDPQIQAEIRAAIAAWEKKYTPGM